MYLVSVSDLRRRRAARSPQDLPVVADLRAAGFGWVEEQGGPRIWEMGIQIFK